MNWSLPTPPSVEAIEEWLSGAVMEGRKWCPYITLSCDGDHSQDVGFGGKKMGNET